MFAKTVVGYMLHSSKRSNIHFSPLWHNVITFGKLCIFWYISRITTPLIFVFNIFVTIQVICIATFHRCSLSSLQGSFYNSIQAFMYFTFWVSFHNTAPYYLEIWVYCSCIIIRSPTSKPRSEINEMLGFRRLLLLMRSNRARYCPGQWNGCVKHAPVLDQSSIAQSWTHDPAYDSPTHCLGIKDSALDHADIQFRYIKY